MLTVYGDERSGNCYKVKLILNAVDIAHRWEHVDILAGETQSAAFAAINPAGQIPAVALEDGTVLAQSNAILWYFGAGTPWVPDDRFGQARMLEWMFFEQYSHEPYIATARFWLVYLDAEAQYADRLAENRPKGYKALGVMETQLGQHDWLTGDTPTLADMSLYAYTHVASEGGYDLADYPAVRDWLGRFAGLDTYVPMVG